MFKKKIITIIDIEGMSCEHCAMKVKKALEKIENVKQVKVNLSKKKAIITSYDQVDQNKIKDQIEKLDYKVLEMIVENI